MFNLNTKWGNNYFTEMCSGSEAGSYPRLIDFVYPSTLGLSVIKKKEEEAKGRTDHELALDIEVGVAVPPGS